MKTIVEALKGLHTKMGGSADDQKGVQTISEMLDKVTEVAGGSGGGGAGATLDIVYKLSSDKTTTTQVSHTVEEIDAFVEAHGVKGLTLTITYSSAMSAPMCESIPCKMKNNYGMLVFDGLGSAATNQSGDAGSINIVRVQMSTTTKSAQAISFNVGNASGGASILCQTQNFTISA
jgi:hypothetical protein